MFPLSSLSNAHLWSSIKKSLKQFNLRSKDKRKAATCPKSPFLPWQSYITEKTKQKQQPPPEHTHRGKTLRPFTNLPNTDRKNPGVGSRKQQITKTSLHASVVYGIPMIAPISPPLTSYTKRSCSWIHLLQKTPAEKVLLRIKTNQTKTPWSLPSTSILFLYLLTVCSLHETLIAASVSPHDAPSKCFPVWINQLWLTLPA